MNYYDIINNYNYKVDKVIKKIIIRTLKKENIKNSYVSIVLTDNDELQLLNKKYRKKDKTTDVLSFPINSNKNCKYNILGDIYINIDKVKSQAIENNHSELRELGYLLIHGILHLLGYSDDKLEEENIMIMKQEEILNEFKRTKI